MEDRQTGVSFLKIVVKERPSGVSINRWVSEKKKSSNIKRFKSWLNICFAPGRERRVCSPPEEYNTGYSTHPWASKMTGGSKTFV
ncbi:hypothetical protein TNCV_4261531 [Trichonephila clavipes]|nr:hypothetical protein TNCV_4261531 [Trichonephila clavipes]